MIRDVETIGEFLAAGSARPVVARLNAPDISAAGVEIDEGHMLIESGLCLPVMNGVTSSNVFGFTRRDRYPPLCAKGLGPVVGEIADAVFIDGSPNYYHFLAFDLPQFLLLQARRAPRLSLVMCNAFRPAIADMMKAVVASLAGGREVAVSVVPSGTYALKNVLLGTRPKTSLPPFMCRQLLLPLALQKAGVKDPIQDLGPVKLFVRREKAANGRNLINQAEIEDWCVRRGYTSVNPGTLTLHEQIILFARATHIVGVEGAAMTNLLFAVNAVDVTMISSPAVNDEKFFSAIAKYYPYKFQIVPGQIDVEAGGEIRRSADYALVLDLFDAVMKLKGLG